MEIEYSLNAVRVQTYTSNYKNIFFVAYRQKNA